MGEKGQIEGASSPRTSSHSWGLRNYLQMSGPQIHFRLNYMIDCPKGPEFPLNNCIMFLLCFSCGDLVMRVKQMWLICSGSPNVFQSLIYSFWTGQNQPCLHSQRAITSFKLEGQKCVNANEVNLPFSAPGEEKAIQNSLVFGLELGLCFSSNSVL